MNIQLMLTCLCDAFYGEVGISAVRVLRAAGCEVVFPEGQTCCGQPPFNSGDWNAARRIGEHYLSVFDPTVPIVTPSGSCAAMVREGFPMLWPDRAHIECYEVGEFLVKMMGILSWPPIGTRPATVSQIDAPKVKVAFHRACHGRALGLTDEQEQLVRSLPGIEVMPFDQADQCCGFGGAFAATHGKLSSEIGREKLLNVIESGAELLVSADMGCLMHLQGLIDTAKLPMKTAHYLQLLAEALPK